MFRTYASFRPLLEANWSKVKAIMMEGNLSRALKEAIAWLVSKDNGRNYCIAAQETSLQAVGVRPEEIRRIETNLESQNGPVPPHEWSEMMRGKATKIILLILIASLVGAFFFFDLGQYLTLDYLKTRQQDFQQFYAAHRAFTLGAYFILYVVVTALSLPGAAIMTLAGGALFGFLPALIVVSFASSIGATLAFLVSRFLLRDWVQRRFGKRLQAINAGVEKEGAFYLFSLRLVPIFPFFVINLAMGLTPLRTLTFYWVSQVGMLPGTAVYVNAGTQLGQIQGLSGILSPGLLFSFALLGVFPLIARKGVDYMKSRQSLK